jgi:ferritin-like metal-binding protein YciE
MPAAETLHDAFVKELRDTYDAEKQLTKALPKMAKAATSEELRAAIEEHLEVTRGQVERLEDVFLSLDEKARGKHCDGMGGIIEEAKSILEEDFDEETMDACIIAAAQRAEHYEMAAYGTLAAWARAMNHTEAASLLEETLQEEKDADELLSSIAEGSVNKAAAARANGDGSESDEEEEDTPSRSKKKARSAPAKKSRAAGARSTPR